VLTLRAGEERVPVVGAEDDHGVLRGAEVVHRPDDAPGVGVDVAHGSVVAGKRDPSPAVRLVEARGRRVRVVRRVVPLHHDERPSGADGLAEILDASVGLDVRAVPTLVADVHPVPGA